MSAIAEKYGIDLSRDHKTGCPKCIRNGGDSSRNNLHVYGATESAFCFACSWTIPSKEHREAMGWVEAEEYEEEEVSTREKITAEENERIKAMTSNDGIGWRGIKKETNIFFGVRYQFDQETGLPIKQFVPTTVANELSGYRTRVFPKSFESPIGQVGAECDFVGQFRFASHAGTVCIVGGEVDQLSLFQVLKDNQVKRGKTDFDTTAVVCSTLGEQGTAKQAKAQYEWLSRQKKIVVMLDSDKAGEEAAEKLAKVLPKGKVFIAKLRLKDPNSYIWDNVNNRPVNREQDLINDFWNAQPYTPAGVVAAGTIYDEIVERSKVDKLPFPPYLNKLNKMLAGGINYGYIVNILAGSGCGKSSVVNSCVTHWMTECDKKVLVVSLEAEASEFGENLLSSYMGRKIAMIEDRDARIAYVSSDEAREASKSLFLFPDGSPRLYLMDDRGDFSKLQEKIEECVTMHDISIVCIDVISDVFSGATLEEVDKWMKWEKNLVKATNCILVQVAHTKKPAGSTKAASQGGTISEEMLIGSGTQFRSAGINIALQRDKSHEDLTMRNTTEVFLLKSRSTGITGKALELFYDNQTATLWDKEEYLMAHPHEF